MINVEDLRGYCLSLGDGVEEKLPFAKFKGGDSVLVFYVCGHMFCYFDIDAFTVVSVKCQPERIAQLREEHACVCNPINQNPNHWLGLTVDSAPETLIRELIANSYEIVKAKYTKRSKSTKSSCQS